MKKINNYILFPLENYRIGGVTSYTALHAHGVLKERCIPIVIGGHGDAIDGRDFVKGSILFSVERLGSGKLGHMRESFAYIVLLYKIFARYQVRHIHFGTVKSSLLCLFCLPAWYAHKTVTYHGDWALEVLSFRNTLGDRTFHFIKRRIMQWFIIMISTRVVALSEYARQQILNFYPFVSSSKIIVIAGSTLQPKTANKYARNSFKTRTLTIINIGRFDKRKGHEQLLEACKILQRNHVPYLLKLVGPFPLSDIDQVLRCYDSLGLGDSVQIIHALTGREKINLLSHADVFVMPSQDLVTFGLTIVEALSVGLPVLGTNVGAIPEILTNVDSRLIIPGKDAKSIAQKIIWFAGLTINQRRNISKKCFAAYNKHYSLNRVEQVFNKSILMHRN